MAFFYAATCFGMLLAAQQPPMPIDPALKQELMQFQGSWLIEALEDNGKKLDADELKGRTLLFAGDHFVLRGPNNLRQHGMVKLGFAKKPKTLNATVLQGKERGTTMLGIYAFDGDTLKICLDVQGEERPKEFAAPADSNRQFMICKRIRVKDEVELSGTYRSVSTSGGQEYVAEAVIERLGDAYLVQYKMNGFPVYVGFGMRKGSAFCQYWQNQGQAGLTIYQIEPGPRLVGRFMHLAGAGILEEEILTRIDGKDAAAPRVVAPMP
jgi:uncharacterized protein (TIGR03067 family)